jgi:ubiquinone/menaquinone biosynthesis C-methylase UbiE
MKNAYGEFAKYYDLMGWNQFARICAPRLRAFFKIRSAKPETILNLACGTGELEKLLSNTGIKFTGVDASKEMLKIARKKCPRFKFVLGDAASVRLKKKFDMVLMLFDSANHLNSLSHLKRTFKNVRLHLKEDGFFIFDINTEEGLKNWAESSIRRSHYYTVIVMSKFNQDKMKAYTHIEAFIKEGKRHKQVIQKVTEIAFTPADIFNSLTDAGLGKIAVSSFNVDEEIEEAKRLWFVCS